MSAEELMIGDWVMSIHPAVPRPIKVTEVGGDDIGYKNGILHISFIEPIPITPGILEKNGFYPIYKDEKSAYKWKEYDEDDKIQSIIIDFERKRVSEVWSDRTRKSYKGEIVYVHELQQIIKICGISQTIEL